MSKSARGPKMRRGGKLSLICKLAKMRTHNNNGVHVVCTYKREVNTGTIAFVGSCSSQAIMRTVSPVNVFSPFALCNSRREVAPRILISPLFLLIFLVPLIVVSFRAIHVVTSWKLKTGFGQFQRVLSLLGKSKMVSLTTRNNFNLR